MIYVSGPMTGYEQFNYPAFERVTKELRELGLAVISPHEINPNDGSVSYEDCLRRDLLSLLLCDSMYMMLGWNASKGATLEKHIADCLGFKIEFERTK